MLAKASSAYTGKAQSGSVKSLALDGTPLKTGAYKLKMKVTAAGNGNYKKAVKTAAIKIKVK